MAEASAWPVRSGAMLSAAPQITSVGAAIAAQQPLAHARVLEREVAADRPALGAALDRAHHRPEPRRIQAHRALRADAAEELGVHRAVQDAGDVEQNHAADTLRIEPGVRERHRAAHGVPDKREGALHAAREHAFQHARQVLRGIQVIALVGVAEAGKVHGVNPVALGQGRNDRDPVARRGLAQAVHQHHRLGAFRAGLVKRDPAAEHRLLDEFRRRIRSPDPVARQLGRDRCRCEEIRKNHEPDQVLC